MTEKLRKWFDDDGLYRKYLSFPQRIPFHVTKFIKECIPQINLITSDILDKGVSGFIKEEDDGKIYICVHQFDPPNRKRFTICHELGHYFLHKSDIKRGFIDGIGKSNIGRSGDYNVKEMEANNFAMELLMPELNFRRVFKMFDGNISEIAIFFIVSESTAYIRAKYLNLIKPDDDDDDYLFYFF